MTTPEDTSAMKRRLTKTEKPKEPPKPKKPEDDEDLKVVPNENMA